MQTLYYSTLQTSQVDGTAVTTNGADTSMLTGTQAKFTLPAQFLQFIGQALRIRAAGRLSTTTGTNTLTLKVLFGATAVFAAPAVTLVASQTTQTWELDLTMILRAVGGSATLMTIGKLMASVAVLANGNVMLPATAPAVGSTFDSTATQTVDLTANWSATGNSLTCHQFQLDSSI